MLVIDGFVVNAGVLYVVYVDVLLCFKKFLIYFQAMSVDQQMLDLEATF